jgi:hypothetical protein
MQSGIWKIKNDQLKPVAIKIAVFLSLFSLLFFIASRDEEAYKTGSWRSTLYVDPAGYNVYLPATFQHAFIHDFPEKADSLVAYGFMVNKEKQVITKFTYGVALLQSPFYVAGLGISKIFGIENTGFSYFNQVLIDLIGIFYGCLGILFLYAFLANFFSRTVSVVSTAIIFIGTNTLYYATIQPGMSHIYSFFLVNTSLYFMAKHLNSPSDKKFWFLSLLVSLIILIRPINIIFIIPLMLINIGNTNELRERFKLIFTIKNILIFSLVLFLLFLPQFAYWKFTYGKWLADSYPGEGFAYWDHPQIKRFLFAPHNGLLAYNPLYLLLFICVLFLFKKYKVSAWSYVIVISLLIYLSASWYLYFFGCGFGARNMVEYSGLLAFPLASFLENHFKKFIAIVFSLLIVICMFVNLKLMYSWDICFWGKNDWAWKEYKYLLWKPHKILIQNTDSLDNTKLKQIGNDKVYEVSADELYAPGFNFEQFAFTDSYFKTARINVDIMAVDSNATAQLACMGINKDSTAFYNGTNISAQKGRWSHHTFFTGLAFDENKNFLIKIFIMNDKKQRFYIKNFKVELE